jgi:hypothetical protein
MACIEAGRSSKEQGVPNRISDIHIYIVLAVGRLAINSIPSLGLCIEFIDGLLIISHVELIHIGLRLSGLTVN